MADAFLKRVIAQRAAEQEAAMSGPGRSLPEDGDRTGGARTEARPDGAPARSADAMTEDLCVDIVDIRAGRLSVEQAAAISGVIGRLVGIAKIQIAYAAARNEVPDIPFLNRKRR